MSLGGAIVLVIGIVAFMLIAAAALYLADETKDDHE